MSPVASPVAGQTVADSESERCFRMRGSQESRCKHCADQHVDEPAAKRHEGAGRTFSLPPASWRAVMSGEEAGPSSIGQASGRVTPLPCSQGSFWTRGTSGTYGPCGTHWTSGTDWTSTVSGTSGSTAAVGGVSSSFAAQPIMTLVRDDLLEQHPSSVPLGCLVQASHLSRWYSFKGTCVSIEGLSPNAVIIRSPSVQLLLESYRGWSRQQLRTIAAAHGCPSMGGTETKSSIIETLTQKHTCSRSCASVMYVFSMCTNERRADVKERCSPQRRKASVDVRGVDRDVPVEHYDSFPTFPEVCPEERKLEIIQEFQNHFQPEKWVRRPCAVCGQGQYARDVVDICVRDVDLELLRNDNIDSHLWPEDYNFEAYDRAFLESRALSDVSTPKNMSICFSCKAYLGRKQQPPDAIANFQYYAHGRLPVEVKDAFAHASIHDLQLASACRATQISFTYTADRAGHTAAQRFCKGNIAIIPQDVADVLRVLPPSPEDMQFTICVLFVGGSKSPTTRDLYKLHPVLVDKNRVETITRFLVNNNRFYKSEGVTFSHDNLDALCPDKDFPDGVGVPSTVEVCHLPDEEPAVQGAQSGYSERAEGVRPPENELLMEVVGYSSAEQGAADHSSIKMDALQWCKDHRLHVQVKAGSELFPDQDERMLTFLFPRLDPYGLGGFNNPLRVGRQRIGMERQLRNLLNRYDSPFEHDPAFAYVCWNVLQKLDAVRSVSFRVQDDQYQPLCDELVRSADTLDEMQAKWKVNPAAEPSNAEEKRALALLHKLRVVSKDLRGSNGHRLKLRNEIRALLKVHGCPALFVMLNPADVHHKLVHVLAGGDPERFQDLNAYQRAKQVAEHPKAGAEFFDHMIQAFIRFIVRHGDSRPGLFGTSEAYYGTVEAQGRGTLHCHMLIWLKGNPSPQELRDRMREDFDFRQHMFSWIESIIKCELSDMSSILTARPGERIVKPSRERADDIRTTDGPCVPEEMDDNTWELFMNNFRHFVKELAIKCNWHDHKDTCWKHLRSGEPRDDAHCRMRMDGKTRAITDLDPDTFSILLRRLHPWINNYNDVVLFLLKCNMDIKYIGSGEAAKALVYYVTDYITKTTLPTHLGLAAVCYAIRSNSRKFADKPDATECSMRRSLLIKIVNAMMACQEISHQQVMSYLIGCGDHYCSHTFRSLYWSELDRYFETQEQASGANADGQMFVDDTEPNVATELDIGDLFDGYDIHDEGGDARLRDSIADRARSTDGNGHEDVYGRNLSPTNGASDDADGGTEDEDNRYLACPTGKESVPFRMRNGEMNVTSLLYDYRYRSRRPSFERLSVWEHVEYVEKVTKSQEEKRLSCLRQNQKTTAAERVEYSSPHHPQFKTHVSRLRRRPVVPVYLGPAIPRKDSSEVDYTRYCRCMLLLFKPWRTLDDVKSLDQSWEEAFHAYNFPEKIQAIIRNIHIERECRDAHNGHEEARRRGEVGGLLNGDSDQYPRDPLMDDDIQEDVIPDHDLGEYGMQDKIEDNGDIDATQSKRQAGVDARVRETVNVMDQAGLFAYEDERERSAATENNDQQRYNPTPEDMRSHQKTMAYLKKHKRPRVKDVNPNADGDLSRPELPPTVGLGRILDSDVGPEVPGHVRPQTKEEILEDLLLERNVKGNFEQEMAVRKVAEHFMRRDQKQLMMYVSGVGGTGKSHLIRTIVEFFRRCDRSGEVLLGAYTGIAAVLIGGYTLHALGCLPKSLNKAKRDELTQIWKDVDYLIIDEVSMLSPNLLSDLSGRIAEAKSWRQGAADLSFGGVNLLFTGDFGQLKPVEAQSLLSHKLVTTIEANQGQTFKGQKELHGVSIWRQVDQVVELKKNWRHDADPRYADLINRVRVGRGSNRTEHNGTSDYDLLCNRMLNMISAKQPEKITDFRDAPVIVGTRKVRDAINMRTVQAKAKYAKRELKYYASRDSEHQIPLTGAIAARVRRLQPALTKEAYGLLPLFVGMRVLISDNADVLHGIANGAEGYVEHITTATDTEGQQYATSAYVRVAGSGFQIEGLETDLVPIFPLRTSFVYRTSDMKDHSISRLQLPLHPAYAYTDYKSQGRSLTRAIVDLTGCRSLQSTYVMLSRVKTLEGLAILRWFPPVKINEGLKHEFRAEFERLDMLATETRRNFIALRSTQST